MKEQVDTFFRVLLEVDKTSSTELGKTQIFWHLVD